MPKKAASVTGRTTDTKETLEVLALQTFCKHWTG